MVPSVIGLAVVAVLLLLGRRLRTGLIWPMFASLAFGATAFAVLADLGGASPLIYTLICLLMIAAVPFRRNLSSSLRAVFVAHPACWLIVGLLIYCIAGAIIFPRMFQGDTLVYVVGRKADGTSAVVAVPLAPLTANATQACYLVLGGLTCLASLLTLLDASRLEDFRRAALTWIGLVIATGLIDLGGAAAGLGDVLAPLRTANYAMMTGEEHAIAGFKRINGGFSEASAYAGAIVAALAFSIGYWRATSDPMALLLTLICMALLVISTSTTAYVTAGICGIWLTLGALGTMLWRGTIRTSDVTLLALAAIAVAVIMAIYIANEAQFAPIIRLLELTILDKVASDSAIERGNWNAIAIQALLDTWGLGVGIGSTRTSSWSVAVVSHLGIPGAALMAGIVWLMLRGLSGLDVRRAPVRIVGLAQGGRAAGLTSLVASSVSAPYADPGILFFLMLAAVLACRHHLKRAGYARSTTAGTAPTSPSSDAALGPA